MYNLIKTIFSIFLLFLFQFSKAQTSTLVSVGSNGKLVYTADSKGNKVPDFSGVGYLNSESPIPTVGVVRTVYPVSGDNLTNVQNAINQVAALPLDANGFRGTILFKAGKYLISDTIKINATGIVLRGEGKDSTTGTHFVSTKAAPISLFYFAGTGGTDLSYTSRKAITNAYVPFGTNQVTVASGHTFITGDKVMLHRIPKQSWIDLLTMAQWGWTFDAYDVYVERKVSAVSGNVITLDAPIVDHIDTTYATAELFRYTSSRSEKCGIENMCISSTYASETDENHGWEAVTFYNTINGWAKDLDVYYFGYAAVHVLDGAAWITVQNCRNFDPKSLIDGGRRYSFNVDGQRSLVQNCFTRNGRHDYVNGSRSNGPVVFYNCTATNQLSDIGPHHRWSTGILYDNIFAINGRIDVQNRTSSGTGHGWAGAEIMFWNCEGDRMVIQDPQGDNRNWAIGCVFNQITNVGDMTTEPLGIVESSGIHIAAIPSLFMKQLAERLEPLKQTQTISFPAFSTKLYNDSDFVSNATASSGLTVTLTSSNTSVATIVNGLIHIVGVGVSTITASQAGDNYYAAATSVNQTLTISKSNQTITFSTLPSKNYGANDFSPGATASSGLTVSYSSSNTSVATIVSNKIHIVGVGSSNITASQSGNTLYNAATSVVKSLVVSKSSQTITFPNITTKTISTADFGPGATSNSGLTVTYTSSNTSVATIIGSSIHIVGRGVSTITASQSGNTLYNAATSQTQTLTVTGLAQTITFGALSNKVIGDVDFSLGATATSGIAVTYTSSNTAVATIVGNNIHIVSAGSAIITANQIGNSTYDPAVSVSQNLNVNNLLTYVPNSTTVLSGSIQTGIFGNLTTNNSSYFVVNSTNQNGRKTDWYGSVKITQSPSSITQFTLNYDGNNSLSNTQVLYLYNFLTSSWTQIDSRIVSSTDVAISYTTTTPLMYISTTGEIRARVYSSGATVDFKSSGDWMQFVVQTTSLGQSYNGCECLINNNTVGRNQNNVNAIGTSILYPGETNLESTLEYTLNVPSTVSICLLNENGEKIKTLSKNKLKEAGVIRELISLQGISNGKYSIQINVESASRLLPLIINK
jgi:hypothetical protein